MLKRFWLLAGCAVFLSVNSWALTASDILTRARIYLADQSANAARQTFSDATLLSFLSDGQREANAIGFVLQSSYTFSLAGNVTEYSLPADYMTVLNVWYKNPNGQYRKLDATSFNMLDTNSSGWRSASCGTPQNYYLDMGSQTVMMGMYPCPSAAAVGSILTSYVQQTTDITSTSAIPFNGRILLTPYGGALADYVTMRGYWALGEIDLSKPFEDRWNTFLTIIKQGIMRQPDFNPGVAGRRNE